MGLTELETAVTRLPAEDLAAFAKWFEEFLADEWDRQIEADSKAGKLNRLIEQSLAEHKAGKSRPL